MDPKKFLHEKACYRCQETHYDEVAVCIFDQPWHIAGLSAAKWNLYQILSISFKIKEYFIVCNEMFNYKAVWKIKHVNDK